MISICYAKNPHEKSQALKKIYPNISESPFIAETEYFIFKFCSAKRRQKFYKKLSENRLQVSERLTSRYHFLILAHRIADIYLYREIEDRGCWIKDKESGKIYTDPFGFGIDGQQLFER